MQAPALCMAGLNVLSDCLVNKVNQRRKTHLVVLWMLTEPKHIKFLLLKRLRCSDDFDIFEIALWSWVDVAWRMREADCKVGVAERGREGEGEPKVRDDHISA